MDRPRDAHELIASAYKDLRAAAERYFRRQPPGFTLCPTEIVHEACLHLIRQGEGDWTSTGHFRAIAIRKVWQVIVDHLRQRRAQKRGGRPPPRRKPRLQRGTAQCVVAAPAWKRVPLDSVTVEWRDREVELLDLADALAELGRESRRLCEVVTLHWFGGMTHAEVSQRLGVSQSTTEKDFRYAVAWLNRRLQGTPAHEH